MRPACGGGLVVSPVGLMTVRLLNDGGLPAESHSLGCDSHHRIAGRNILMDTFARIERATIASRQGRGSILICSRRGCSLGDNIKSNSCALNQHSLVHACTQPGCKSNKRRMTMRTTRVAQTRKLT